MSIKLSTKSFIDKSNIIHNHKYDYSNTIYTLSKDLVTIICPIHGKFNQIANNHLMGKGCKKCRDDGNRKLLSDFIDRANLFHNHKYDYSHVVYIRCDSDVEIICPTHGIFKQPPSRHLRCSGCYLCSKVSMGKKLILSNDEFINRSIVIHCNKYDYSLVNYKGSHSKVKIICPTHGIFEQLCNSHLIGKGCKLCAIVNSKLSLKEFIDKCNSVHSYKYDYSKTNYTYSNERVIIICKYHGEFEQFASSHISGIGCPRCTHFVSKSETKWLNILNIPLSYRNKTIMINDRRFNVDAYDPQTNTVYEFYGDYWHGNLKVYKSYDFNKNSKKTFGELYNDTVEKEMILRNSYNVISVWESDFKSKEKDKYNE